MNLEITAQNDPSRVYFSHKELADPSTNEGVLHPAFRKSLLYMRSIYGHPMIVTSCCRSEEHNWKVGGHKHSLHIYDTPHRDTDIEGCGAIDIVIPPVNLRIPLMRIALSLGWSIGVRHDIFHLDMRNKVLDLPATVFGYKP